MKPSVLIVEEKHGLRVFDAHDEEALHRSALLLLRERIKQNWYTAPKEPEPPDISLEQLATLPDGPTKKRLHTEWANHRLRMHSFRKWHAVWADIVVADERNDGMRAWRALRDRSGFEYEGVRLVELEGIDTKE